MKKLHILTTAAALAAVAMLASCEKLLSPVIAEETSVEATTPDASRLVSYKLTASTPAKQAVESYLRDSASIEAPMCFDIDLEEYGIYLKAYRFTYNTVDISGNSIVLSGDLCYINGGSSCKRCLESVSLFHPAFATAEEHCCEYEQYSFIGRSCHNALVVYPHYQGFYASSELRITPSESLLKARQAIDCEVAALELVEKLDDVCMSPLYYTENMGISCGTGAALATQYLLEQDKEMQEINRKYIRLYSTYCCEGPYKYSDLITYFADSFPYEDLQDVEDFSQVGLISLIVGTFDTWKGQKDESGNEYFQGIDVYDYFNPTLFTRTDLYDEATQVKDVVQYFRDGKLDHHTKMFKKVSLSSREMINPDFFTTEGTFDTENALIKELYSAMDNNNVITDGWNPRTKLVIAHSWSDELVPYKQAVDLFHNLSHYGVNPLVSITMVPGLGHTNGNQFFAIRDIILKKHPCD